MWTVYKHTSPSGKVYIGITSRKPEERWANGRGYHHNKYFQNAINKYGWNNIKHEILYTELTKEEAEQKEIELIKFYDSTNRDIGYNISSGGNAAISSENTRKKISQALKGKYKGCNSYSARKVNQYDLQGNLIKTWNCICEAGEKLNIDYTNIVKCCTYKILSAGGYQWRYIEDNNIGVYNREFARCRKINQYDLQGNFIKTWESSSEAQRILNINYASIIKCCNKQRKSAGGYIWRYLEDTKIGDYEILRRDTKVEQYSLDGTYIKTWDSIKQANEYLNIPAGAISRVCLGKNKKTHGFIWRYAS